MNVTSKQTIRIKTHSGNYQIMCLCFHHVFMNWISVQEAAVRKIKRWEDFNERKWKCFKEKYSKTYCRLKEVYLHNTRRAETVVITIIKWVFQVEPSYASHHYSFWMVHRYDSLSLWNIPLKCPLSSFNPWLLGSICHNSLRDGVIVSVVASFIQSASLEYLVQPRLMVCGLKILGKLLDTGSVPSVLPLSQFQSPSLIDLSDSYHNTINMTHYSCGNNEIE